MVTCVAFTIKQVQYFITFLVFSSQVIAAKGPLYVFYFLFVIFLGPFYLINLVLAVVSLSYEQETAAMQDEELKVSTTLCIF